MKRVSFRLLNCAMSVMMFIFIQNQSMAQGSWSDGNINGFTPRTYCCAAVIDHKIYVIGGFPSAVTPGAMNTMEVYDPGKDEWTTPETTGSFTARGGCTATVVDGKIYVIGGYDENWTALNLVEVYDPVTKAWTAPKVTGLATPRHRHGAVYVNGKIYIFGGMSQTNYETGVETFDPATNTWSTVATSGKFTARRAAGFALINGRIFVHGGYNGSKALNTLEVFDPSTNVWSTPPADLTSSARYGGAVSVLNNTLYHFGGFNLQTMVTQVESYNPQSNEWNIEDANGVFTGRSGLISCEVDGKIYAIGGSTLTSLAANNEIFTPKLEADVETESATTSFSIYPNPTTSDIQLSSIPPHTSALILLDIYGNTLAAFSAEQSSMMRISLQQFPAGTYFLKTANSGKSLVSRVVKY